MLFIYFRTVLYDIFVLSLHVRTRTVVHPSNMFLCDGCAHRAALSINNL